MYPILPVVSPMRADLHGQGLHFRRYRPDTAEKLVGENTQLGGPGRMVRGHGEPAPLH